MEFAILFDILIGEPFPLLWLTEPLLKRSHQNKLGEKPTNPAITESI
ncbi:hypothetical protein H6F98_20625 [Microcoleus sp. FACHB-SPT15]|nr:hypothetical protein [Microcoleus sp. FACHB-SPT15]MBD1807836.1 hypothetical protein [Microcoleus sp. FACHB-SPT15]